MSYTPKGNLKSFFYLNNADVWEAANLGDLNWVKTFVEEQNIDPNAIDSVGSTPLHWAAYRNHIAIVNYLLIEKNANINEQNYNKVLYIKIIHSFSANPSSLGNNNKQH
jgi:ankyrin repeat protein